MKKSRKFLENRSPFSKSPTDIPYAQIGIRERLADGIEKKFRFFYDPVVGFAEKSRRDSMRRKKRDFFRESLSDFSFFADIPNVRNRSRTADATKKWRFFLRISAGFRVYPQIYPVYEIRRRTVVGVKSDDFFRESLPDRGFFCRYTMRASDAVGTNAVGVGEKNANFLRKHRQFSCLFPDIPCAQRGLSGLTSG